MNHLPESTELHFLITKSIQQICLGLHQVIIMCSDDVTISIESKLTYRSRRSPTLQVWKPGTREPSVNWECLLGHNIVNYQVLPDGALNIFFDNDSSIRINDEATEYESFQITHGTVCIVV